MMNIIMLSLQTPLFNASREDRSPIFMYDSMPISCAAPYFHISFRQVEWIELCKQDKK